MDSWTGQTSSFPVQGHDDLENETVRRRHVTGEGHNGDTLTSAVSVMPTGKISLQLLHVLSFRQCFDDVLTSNLKIFCKILLSVFL